MKQIVIAVSVVGGLNFIFVVYRGTTDGIGQFEKDKNNIKRSAFYFDAFSV